MNRELVVQKKDRKTKKASERMSVTGEKKCRY